MKVVNGYFLKMIKYELLTQKLASIPWKNTALFSLASGPAPNGTHYHLR